MIIFFYGEDDFRAKEKIKEMKKKFLKEVDPTGSALSVLNGKEAEMKDVRQKIGAPSLLSRKRMLVLEDVFSSSKKGFLEEVGDYFREKEEKGMDDIIVFYQFGIKIKKKGNKTEVIKTDASGRDKALTVKEKKLFDILSKQRFSQEFKKLNIGESASWIKDRCLAKGGDMSLRTAQKLSSLVGGDLWRADKEMEKLVNYKKGKLPRITEDNNKVRIEEEDVQELVKGVFDDDIFVLTDAVSSRDKASALKFLEEMYDSGASDSYLIAMIFRQVKILAQIRSSLDSGMSSRQITSEFKLHPFVVQKGINQARNFSSQTLKRILDKLVEIDKDMKTGRGNGRIFLNLLLSKI